MSYIASDSVTIATSTNIDSYKSVSGRSTIEIAMPGDNLAATVLEVGSTTWKAVGAVDGTVSITPNHDVIKLQSSALQNPYAVIDTAYDWQVTFNLQEVDLHNWALALGYDAASVGSDATDPNLGTQLSGVATRADTNTFNMSVDHGLTTSLNEDDVIKLESGDSGEIETFLIDSVQDLDTINLKADGAGTAVFGEGTSFPATARAWHGGSNFALTASIDRSRLNFNSSQNAKYRAMRIVTASAGSSTYVPGSATAHQVIVFFKVRFQATGSIDLDRTAAQAIPVTAHCLGNTADESGALFSGVTLGDRNYG